jgi:hypothetical protein
MSAFLFAGFVLVVLISVPLFEMKNTRAAININTAAEM